MRREVVCPEAKPLVLAWEVADTSEVAEVEYGLEGNTLVVLLVALGSCRWLGGLSRLVVEFSADGRVDTLLLAVVGAWDMGTSSSLCPPLALPLAVEILFSL